MERLSTVGATVTPLSGGWTMILTEANACAEPEQAFTFDGRIQAPVPGTVAEALEVAGLFDRAAPRPLLDTDAWYFCDLSAETPGSAILRFEGLATIAEIYINGQRVADVESMFETHDVPVVLKGHDRLSLCFRALGPHLDQTGPRARWRPRMINHQGYRLVRTSLLGAMPGWCPDIHPLGPFRPVSLLRPGAIALHDVTLKADLAGDQQGRLSVSFRASGAPNFELECNGQSVALTLSGEEVWHGQLELAGIEPWWPHTHGTPHLYPVRLKIDGQSHDLGHTGFRSVVADPGADGLDFGLLVNGERIFCRGAVWTNADIVRLGGSEADYLPTLEKAVEAGMNMIRIGGTMTYETAAFFQCCDRLGLMVWQDFMFANFDYPVKSESFVAHVRREAGDFLSAIGASPSLFVLCGGSEIHQQAAMLGLAQSFWAGPLTESILPECARAFRPDVVYVPNSPFGGAMPFSPDSGVTHYYGVGAYERPLDDARRANVRFSAESLAFSQVPQQRTLDAHLPVPPVHDPRWKARVPRDRDAAWDFEDTRDHYLHLIYGVDPARLRRENPGRYLDLSRAVTGEVCEAVFAEWRRTGSGCNGGLVWTLQDLLPGAGWGIIDATGEPKPVYYALKRAFHPVQVLLLDEGTNGLDVHVLNEQAVPLDATIEISCLREGRQSVVCGRRALTVEPRGSLRLAATDLFGAFFDTTYAFRFGPPSHDVTVARLLDAEGKVIRDAFSFPLGRAEAMHDATLETSLLQNDGGWSLVISADRLAQSVSIASDTQRAVDDWFHLAPGQRKVVPLAPRPGTDPAALPSGAVRSAGSNRQFPF